MSFEKVFIAWFFRNGAEMLHPNIGLKMCWQFSDNIAYCQLQQIGKRAPYIDGLVQERCNSIADTLELRLSCTEPSIQDGSILLNCEITKDNQPKIEYHDQFQVKKILWNLQNTCFISLANQSYMYFGITTILLFCLFCVIVVAIFWWAESSWLHKLYFKMRSSEASSGGIS